MKKIDIIQTTILIIAIMIGYSGIQSLLTTLGDLALYSRLSDYNTMGMILLSFFTAVLLIATCFILIRYNRWIAAKMVKGDPSDTTGDTTQLDIDRRNLVFVLFIGIGLYILVQGIAYAIDDAFYLFKNVITANSALLSKRTYLLLELLRVTFGAFLIYTAPTLTDWIEKNIAVRLKTPTPGPVTPEAPANTPEPPPDTQPN